LAGFALILALQPGQVTLSLHASGSFIQTALALRLGCTFFRAAFLVRLCFAHFFLPFLFILQTSCKTTAIH
jgi:hypothetical protein